ncbi:MAG: S49 family peptidase, partial [Porticoccaceae bacterium]
RFLNLVAEGRHTTPQAVEAVASGRIWTGRQAMEIGLVDSLGTYNDAINAAGLRVGLDKWQVKYIERPLSFQEQLLKQLAGSAVQARQWLAPWSALPPPLAKRAAELAAQLDALAGMNDPRGLYLQCFGCAQP